jgi:hypothetical protein
MADRQKRWVGFLSRCSAFFLVIAWVIWSSLVVGHAPYDTWWFYAIWAVVPVGCVLFLAVFVLYCLFWE